MFAEGVRIRVRSSADPAGAVLEVGRDAWQAFLAEMKEDFFGEA